jgi:hypothetical protein
MVFYQIYTTIYYILINTNYEYLLEDDYEDIYLINISDNKKLYKLNIMVIQMNHSYLIQDYHKLNSNELKNM